MVPGRATLATSKLEDFQLFPPPSISSYIPSEIGGITIGHSDLNPGYKSTNFYLDLETIAVLCALYFNFLCKNLMDATSSIHVFNKSILNSPEKSILIRFRAKCKKISAFSKKKTEKLEEQKKRMTSISPLKRVFSLGPLYIPPYILPACQQSKEFQHGK